MAFKFEKLDVWQKAVELSNDVHQLTQGFSKDELYILTAQFERAADSIALNIAEGSTGQSNDEFRRFLGYAIRSAVEVVTCLYLGKKRTLISQKDFDRFYSQAEEVIKMTQALRRSLQ